MGILDPSIPASRVPAGPLAGLKGTYDRGRNLYNYKPAQLRRTRAKMGAAIAGTGLCRVTTVGDSITAGEGAVPFAVNSWPVRMRAALGVIGVPIAGTGMVPAQAAASGLDSRWTYGAGWSNFSGTSHSFLRQCATSGSTATFASDLPGTVVEVHYSNSSSAFTVAIDGGSAVTVTPAGGTSLATYTATGLSDATHTIVVTVGASGTLYLAGAGVRRTSGLLVSDVGLGGSTANIWQAGPEPYRPGASSRALTSPDLVTLALMTNDVNQSIAAATYKTQMQTAITAYQAASDVLLIAAIPAATLDLSAHRAALYELADSNDLPLLDLFDRWGSFASASGYNLMFDNLHANPAGYADYGRAVAAVVRT